MLFALLLPLVPISIDEPIESVRLPESPAARAWASVGSDTEPAPLDPELVAALGKGAFTQETWSSWARRMKLILAEDSPSARADLCLIARQQGRDMDAWGHYARLVADPGQAAALRHHLWPGVPLEYPALTGGRSPELPEGVQLRPLLPEPSGTWDAEFAYAAVLYELRTASIEGLRIGGSTLELQLTVESTGIELKSWLRQGPPRAFGYLMPEPPGYRIDLEYVDWLKMEGRHAVRELVPPPGDEAWTHFSRVSERDTERPSGKVERLPASLRLGGLTLVDGAPESERSLPAPELLEALIGASVRVVGAGGRSEGDFRGIRMEIPAEDEARERALRYLASALEGTLIPD